MFHLNKCIYLGATEKFFEGLATFQINWWKYCYNEERNGIGDDGLYIYRTCKLLLMGHGNAQSI